MTLIATMLHTNIVFHHIYLFKSGSFLKEQNQIRSQFPLVLLEYVRGNLINALAKKPFKDVMKEVSKYNIDLVNSVQGYLK